MQPLATFLSAHAAHAGLGPRACLRENEDFLFPSFRKLRTSERKLCGRKSVLGAWGGFRKSVTLRTFAGRFAAAGMGAEWPSILSSQCPPTRREAQLRAASLRSEVLSFGTNGKSRHAQRSIADHDAEMRPPVFAGSDVFERKAVVKAQRQPLADGVAQAGADAKQLFAAWLIGQQMVV
jgi:hypothetical protein